MIFLNAPIQQDKIIALLDDQTVNGVHYKLTSHNGMKLVFQTDADDLGAAAANAKKAIKAQQWGSVLFFQAGVEK
ncbi:hypothetical protein [Schleiferilactobacillus harbinensis]|uniref:hypothetical protein n=1 Tax=Schleiferilactobacillus harbinensis TaxID=304207 RepID=UPI0039E95651